MWIFTGKEGDRSLFIHGDRDEFETSRYNLKNLIAWCDEDGFLHVEEITCAEVLAALVTWYDGYSAILDVFERHHIPFAGVTLIQN